MASVIILSIYLFKKVHSEPPSKIILIAMITPPQLTDYEH